MALTIPPAAARGAAKSACPPNTCEALLTQQGAMSAIGAERTFPASPKLLLKLSEFCLARKAKQRAITVSVETDKRTTYI